MRAEGRRSIPSNRRSGRIVETLFVILALMCLPVLLFGNWFVSTYGNADNIAANIAKAEAADSASVTANGETTQGEEEAKEKNGSAYADMGAQHDEAAHEESDHEDSGDDALAEQEQDPTVAAAHKLVDTDEGGSDSSVADLDQVEHTIEETPDTDMDLAIDTPEVPADSIMSDLADVEPDEAAATAPDTTNPFAADPVESLPGTPPVESDLTLGATETDPAAEEPATADPADVATTDADGNPSATELDLTTMLDSESDQPEDAVVEAPPVPQPRTWTKTNGQTATAVFVNVERVNNEPCAIIFAPSNPEKKLPMPLRLLSEADVDYVKDMHRRLHPSN